MGVLRIKNLKYDKNFQLNHCFFFINILFVHIEQASKISPEAAIQMCSLKYVFTEKNKKVGKILKKATLKELIFGKVVGCRSAKVNSIKDILQGFC